MTATEKKETVVSFNAKQVLVDMYGKPMLSPTARNDEEIIRYERAGEEREKLDPARKPWMLGEAIAQAMYTRTEEKNVSVNDQRNRGIRGDKLMEAVLKDGEESLVEFTPAVAASMLKVCNGIFSPLIFKQIDKVLNGKALVDTGD